MGNVMIALVASEPRVLLIDFMRAKSTQTGELKDCTKLHQMMEYIVEVGLRAIIRLRY